MKINIIVFRLSDQAFAFELDKIPLVISISRIDSMRGTIKEIPDTINYMFEEIQIFNLHQIVNIENRPLQSSAKLLIGEHGNLSVGCFVDKIVSVMKISEDDIQKDESIKSEKYVMGEIKNNYPIKLLDVDKILKSEVIIKSIKE